MMDAERRINLAPGERSRDGNWSGWDVCNEVYRLQPLMRLMFIFIRRKVMFTSLCDRSVHVIHGSLIVVARNKIAEAAG